MDALVYNYHNVDEGYVKNTNQLLWVDDAAGAGVSDEDIDDQVADNYAYDEMGNLEADVAEEVERIEWTVAGKVHAIIRPETSSKPDVYFSYDAMGNRVAKKSIATSGDVDITYYFRDASGNVMSTFERESTASSLDPTEYNIFGSERIGMYRPSVSSMTSSGGNGISNASLNTGLRNYECKDHLGNIRVVLSDKLEAPCASRT